MYGGSKHRIEPPGMAYREVILQGFGLRQLCNWWKCVKMLLLLCLEPEPDISWTVWHGDNRDEADLHVHLGMQEDRHPSGFPPPLSLQLCLADDLGRSGTLCRGLKGWGRWSSELVVWLSSCCHGNQVTQQSTTAPWPAYVSKWPLRPICLLLVDFGALCASQARPSCSRVCCKHLTVWIMFPWPQQFCLVNSS